MVDVGIGIGAVSLLKEIANYVKDRGKKDPEFLEKVVELQGVVMDMVATNAGLTEKVHKLEAALQLKETIRFDEETETYWRGNDDGPYCQKCYDKDQKLVRVRNHDEPRWGCTTCNSLYFKPGGRKIFAEQEERRALELKRANASIRNKRRQLW